MNEESKIHCGKYVISHTNGANLKATRNGEEWRCLAGDNLTLALATEVERLQERLSHSGGLYEALSSLIDEISATPELQLSSWGLCVAEAKSALAKAWVEQ